MANFSMYFWLLNLIIKFGHILVAILKKLQKIRFCISQKILILKKKVFNKK